MHPDAVTHGLWLVGLMLQAALLCVLIATKVWRKLPFFLGYVIFSCLETAVLYFFDPHTAAYFWTYWLCETTGVLLGFTVVFEVFQRLFSGHDALRRLATSVFQWTVLGLITLACVVIYTHSSSQQAGFMKGVLVLEEATRVVEVGLLLFLFVFATVLGMHWRQHPFGIALGLGIFTAVELAALAMRVQLGIKITPTFNMVRGLAFDFSLLIWIGYLLAPERAVTGELPKREQLEQWNQAVMEMIGQ